MAAADQVEALYGVRDEHALRFCCTKQVATPAAAGEKLQRV